MWLFNTTIEKESYNMVKKVLDSTMVSAGSLAGEFENKLCDTFGINNLVSVNSGTAALHLALETTNVRGGEVILPAQTFIASGLAICHAGAKPVFADIDYMTGNIDPKSIISKITDNTKAIMVVHWGGYPCDMDEINQIAEEYGLVVIEDAAHAIGSTYKNKPVGNLSDYTCFSFQAIKTLTTGDGGGVSTNTDKINTLRKLRWFNIDREKDKPDILGERVYNSNDLGFKYHMNDYTAALGIGNLSGIKVKLDKCESIRRKYDEAFKDLDGITLFERKGDRTTSNWLYGFHVKDRVNFIKKLKDNDIPSSVIHLGIDDNEIFGGKDITLTNQRKFDDTQIHIPIHDGLSESDVEKIITNIKSGW